MADLFKCPVCLEDMLERNPRLLSCHHTFCESCLNILIQDQKISCPTCRTETAVQEGDVTKLKKDFRLLQMKEEMEKTFKKQTRQCQVCKESLGISMCENCNKLICESCQEKHLKLKVFMDHHIQELCSKHPECGISHICMKCVESVCVNCILVDHCDHEDQIHVYKEGVHTLVSYVKDCKEQIEKIINKNSELRNRKQVKKELVKEAKFELEEEHKKITQARVELERKIDEINIKLKNIIIEQIKIDMKIDKCEADRKKHMKLYDTVKQLEEDMIKGNTSNTMRVLKLVKEELNVKDEWIEEPELVINVENSETFQVKYPVGIASTAEDAVMIADWEFSDVTKINARGEIISKIKTHSKYGKVTNVRTFENMLYIGQKKGITKHHLAEPCEVVDEYDTGVTDISDFDVVNEEMLIIATDGGCLYEYNTKTRTNKQVLSKDDDRKACISYQKGERFLLTYTNLHMIQIYNKEWQLLTYIRNYDCSSLYRPASTCVTPAGFLVADSYNHRVSYFTIEGHFVQHVLTDKDGLWRPRDLCYRPPFLWVTQYSVSTPCEIRCYLVSSQ